MYRCTDVSILARARSASDEIGPSPEVRWSDARIIGAIAWPKYQNRRAKPADPAIPALNPSPTLFAAPSITAWIQGASEGVGNFCFEEARSIRCWPGLSTCPCRKVIHSETSCWLAGHCRERCDRLRAIYDRTTWFTASACRRSTTSANRMLISPTLV